MCRFVKLRRVSKEHDPLFRGCNWRAGAQNSRWLRCASAFYNTPFKNHKNNSPSELFSEQRSAFSVDLYRLQSTDLTEGRKAERTQENLKFVDAGLTDVIRAPALGPFNPDSDAGARLGDFLSRPVLIDTQTWLESNTTAIQANFAPWQLYFNDTGIKKKLENYKLLRCKLHLKFVVNASPFYFGAMRVAYCPLVSGVDQYYTTSDQIKLSQLPGLYLEPAAMTTAEMELPFLWPNAWLDVVENDEFANMGRIQYVLYSKLRSANGVASASVRISCYAWATDVEVAGLTSYLALQADEYAEPGPLSGPASAVAGVAGMLKGVPFVGELATAAETGANLVGGIARAFGYSNPPVVSDVMPYQPKAFHAFSSVDTSVPIDKLTLDPKNEVTIDNSVTGAGDEDPLVLSTLLSHESFVQGALWNGTASVGAVIWTCPVTPMIVAQQTNVQTYINHTPAAYVGRMFKYWRGGVTFKLRFIKTRYHTGRLAITWDPHGVPGNDYETTTTVRIVDLQTEDECTVTIPYKQPQAWLTNTVYANNFSNGSSPSVTVDPRAHNGCIQVRVLTTLTGPATSPEIDILCFSAGAEDMEMSVPNELPAGVSSLALQSQDIPEDMINDTVDLPKTVSLELVTVGEVVKSLRPLLHRATFVETQLVGNPATGASTYVSDGMQNCVNLFKRIPDGWGFNSEASSWAVKTLTAGNSPFNFVANHPLNWVLNMFVGYRGGVVHHFNVEEAGAGTITYFAAERDDRSVVVFPTINGRNRFTTTTTTGAPSNLARNAVAQSSSIQRKIRGHRGMALTNCNTQSALSVVCPQYSQWRFRPAFEPVRDLYPTGGYGEDEVIRVDTGFRAASVGATSPWPIVSHYVAAGTDFNPVYFVCAPTLFNIGVPAAVDTYTP